MEGFFDGASRGNPGKAGAGALMINEEGKVVWETSRFLGQKTNNEAEYAGLIGALIWINNNQNSLKISKINFNSDSQLMIRQLTGLYKVKAPNLIPIFLKAKDLINSISSPITFKDVRRDFNKLADQLANEAMDRKT